MIDIIFVEKWAINAYTHKSELQINIADTYELLAMSNCYFEAVIVNDEFEGWEISNIETKEEAESIACNIRNILSELSDVDAFEEQSYDIEIQFCGYNEFQEQEIIDYLRWIKKRKYINVNIDDRSARVFGIEKKHEANDIADEINKIISERFK